MGQVIIKDTGLNKVGGSATYTTAGSGAWVEFPSGSINSEFTVNTTSYATKTISDGKLTFTPNEITSILPPRFTLRGFIKASDTTSNTALIEMGRTMGIKQVSGGLGLIAALPEAVDVTYEAISRKAVYVLIKNITTAEVLTNDVEYVSYTIQLEQVS